MIEYIRCQLCGERLNKEKLSEHLLQKHGFDDDDYQEYEELNGKYET